MKRRSQSDWDATWFAMKIANPPLRAGAGSALYITSDREPSHLADWISWDEMLDGPIHVRGLRSRDFAASFVGKAFVAFGLQPTVYCYDQIRSAARRDRRSQEK
jgi:hypothetical protein